MAKSAEGHVGWGETIALPSWSYETVESIVSTVDRYLAPIVMGRSAFDQAYFQKQFDETLTPTVSQGFPFAKAAVQIATLDLAAQIAGLSLHRFLGGKVRDTIDLSFALSIDEPQRMAEAARSFPGGEVLQVKVAGDARLDAERVLAVARARPDTDLWIDANQSYRPVHLESFLQRIQGMEQVRCLEQPVKSIDWFGIKRARGRSSLPIAADEGCFSSYDVARLARMEACDLVVLKIAKSAGLWGCQRSAFVAEANGLGLLGSGLTEAGIGFHRECAPLFHTRPGAAARIEWSKVPGRSARGRSFVPRQHRNGSGCSGPGYSRQGGPDPELCGEDLRTASPNTIGLV